MIQFDSAMFHPTKYLATLLTTVALLSLCPPAFSREAGESLRGCNKGEEKDAVVCIGSDENRSSGLEDDIQSDLETAAKRMSFAPKFALGANLGGLLSGATVSVEASAGVSRHLSIDAVARYNPWFEASRQRSVAFGTRWWPWYVYSGWWVSGKARYQEFNTVEELSTEGDRYGGSLSVGYSRLLGKHFNLDVGFGMWGGYESYSVYECETCGSIREQGENYFLRADEFIIALTYIF